MYRRCWNGGGGEENAQYNIDRPVPYRPIPFVQLLFKLSTTTCPYLTVGVQNKYLKEAAKEQVK
jgi:hypothetical protein